jgi:hypothetical protein
MENYESSRKLSFRASYARPRIQDYKTLLDSGFRRNDRVSNFCKRITRKKIVLMVRKYSLEHEDFETI